MDNWEKLTDEYEPLIGKFYTHDGEVYKFIGVMYGGDDYYFVMWRKGGIQLLSCVCDPETYGYELEK